jgi:aminoglycoside phosphotransferase (APT) family kinase protein
MRKIGEGDKSEVFVLPDGRILKLFFGHYAELAPIEAELSNVLVRAGVDAPYVDECVDVDGRPGIIFGNLPEGITLSSEVRKRPWRIVSAARSLARLHAAVHDSSSEELPSQRERLVSEIESSDAISAETRDIALRVLGGLRDGTTVCHNDIHMLNVIVHDSGATLIDWVLATRGNPAADVAGAILQLRFGEQPAGLVAKVAQEAGRVAFWRLYLRRYLSLRPIADDELLRWQLPVAAALAGRRAGRMRVQLQEHIAHLLTGKHRQTLENVG